MKKHFILIPGLVLLFALPLYGAPDGEKKSSTSRTREKQRVIRIDDSAAGPQTFSFFYGGSWIGIRMRDLNEKELTALSNEQDLGVYVESVENESPAAQAGIKAGDILLRWAGIPVLGSRHMSELVRFTPAGRTIHVEVYRDNARQTLRITVADRKGDEDTLIENLKLKEWTAEGDYHTVMPELEDAPGAYRFLFSPGFSGRRMGVHTSELTKQLGQYFGIPDGKGVLITSVVEDSAAAKAGLQAGDVLVSLDGETVTDTAAIGRVLRKSENESVPVVFYRKGKKMEATLVFEKEPAKERKSRGITL